MAKASRAPTPAASVGVAMPVKMEPNTPRIRIVPYRPTAMNRKPASIFSISE